jgi:hypothetical protein
VPLGKLSQEGGRKSEAEILNIHRNLISKSDGRTSCERKKETIGAVLSKLMGGKMQGLASAEVGWFGFRYIGRHSYLRCLSHRVLLSREFRMERNIESGQTAPAQIIACCRETVTIRQLHPRT